MGWHLLTLLYSHHIASKSRTKVDPVSVWSLVGVIFLPFNFCPQRNLLYRSSERTHRGKAHFQRSVNHVGGDISQLSMFVESHSIASPLILRRRDGCILVRRSALDRLLWFNHCVLFKNCVGFSCLKNVDRKS